ncbi:hypothetical protein LB503_004404 [Fusarium chuoi]|nr:hypothetical protein LB503_004404 [Fusarium chuoi]
MPPFGRSAPGTKPSNIDLSSETEPTTILCREIEDVVGKLPWLWLGKAAPPTMDLPWLQSLNLLLTRTSAVFHQNSEWKCQMINEIKHTLLRLSKRRNISGARQVVTSEHLTRALHYFDVRLLVADMDVDERNDKGKPRIDFFQTYYAPDDSDEESNAYEESEESDASEDAPTSPGDQPASSASTSTKPQSSSQTKVSSVNATSPAKRKA